MYDRFSCLYRDLSRGEYFMRVIELMIQNCLTFVLDNQSCIVDYSIVLVILAGLYYLYKQVKSFSKCE